MGVTFVRQAKAMSMNRAVGGRRRASASVFWSCLKVVWRCGACMVRVACVVWMGCVQLLWMCVLCVVVRCGCVGFRSVVMYCCDGLLIDWLID